MRNLIRNIQVAGMSDESARQFLKSEWLVTNGLGGYASGTICGTVTRRYHGLLIAALPAPHGRVLVLNHLAEHLILPDGRICPIGGEEPAATNANETTLGCHHLTEFRLENQLPVWRYECDGVIVEKRIFLLYRQNTAHIHYYLLSPHENVRLQLRPSLHFRGHDCAVSEPLQDSYQLSLRNNQYEISAGDCFPTLRLDFQCENCTYIHEGGSRVEIAYPHEADRGYQSRGQLWTPGYFLIDLTPKNPACLAASTESWTTLLALSPKQAWASECERRQRLLAKAASQARDDFAAELVLAADQFVIEPVGRAGEAVRAQAAGDNIRSIIAGYHWFTDWGRDTMISLEGLTLATGRHDEAGWILRAFANYMRHGLIPNMFPEGKNQGLYHTADATLWYFHALDRYLELTNDKLTLNMVVPRLWDTVEQHRRGTRFGIEVDTEDGLLRQGQQGYQLTWMDAKVGDWVVTPRRGKAVEINALWYNALRLLESWLRQLGRDSQAEALKAEALEVYTSFNRRFWYPQGGYLYDVIDGEHGDDHACRPNQLFAFSLRYPVLEPQRWAPVLQRVQKELLTPVGLRSLNSSHHDYKSKYFGDLRARDAAYHQGTVWAWLIGPFIDAWLAVYPDKKAEAREFLQGFHRELDHACVGSISEIFDAESPFTPRGCIAQAWSVAEVLRAWIKTQPDSFGAAPPEKQ